MTAFTHRFDQLAYYDSPSGPRTPVLLLESEYNRAAAAARIIEGLPDDVVQQLAETPGAAAQLLFSVGRTRSELEHANAMLSAVKRSSAWHCMQCSLQDRIMRALGARPNQPPPSAPPVQTAADPCHSCGGDWRFCDCCPF